MIYSIYNIGMEQLRRFIRWIQFWSWSISRNIMAMRGILPKPLKTLVFLWKPENFSELWVRPVLEDNAAKLYFYDWYRKCRAYFLEGTDITEINPKSLARFRRENLGFVFQDFNLLDTLTISENIALALAINKVPAGSVEPSILDIAGKLNISDMLNNILIRYRAVKNSVVPVQEQLSTIRNSYWQMSQQEH